MKLRGVDIGKGRWLLALIEEDGDPFGAVEIEAVYGYTFPLVVEPSEAEDGTPVATAAQNAVAIKDQLHDAYVWVTAGGRLATYDVATGDPV